jgi:hypothetical protein
MHARVLVMVGSLVALAGAVGGCKSENSLGGDCVLVKRGPDGGSAVQIRESEINAGLQKDFVSFGSIECEDFVCTRDPAFPRDGGSGAAHGYCSKPCANNDACKTGDDAIDKNPKTKLVCRALLLDEATLGQICQTNPADCQTYFGGTSSPFFCARQLTVADGG